MAFQIEFRAPLPETIIVLSVSETVGLTRTGFRGVNRPDDVMLIQWLLVRHLGTDNYLGPPLMVDGVYGAQTDYHLSRFFFNIKDWDRRHKRRSMRRLAATDDLETLVHPVYSKGPFDWYGLMELMGEVDRADFELSTPTLPRPLWKKLYENVKIFPPEWMRKSAS